MQTTKVVVDSRTKAFYAILVVALVSIESTRAFLPEDQVMLVSDIASIATAGAAFAMSVVMFRPYGFGGYGKLCHGRNWPWPLDGGRVHVGIL